MTLPTCYRHHSALQRRWCLAYPIAFSATRSGSFQSGPEFAPLAFEEEWLMASVTVALPRQHSVLLELIAGRELRAEDVATRVLKRGLADELRRLSPADFESLVASSLRRRGFQVEHVGGKGDEGLDVVARRGKDLVAVQCKRYNGTRVTPAAVREFLGALVPLNGARGVFITTSTFSSAARDYARAQKVELVDEETLLTWLTTEDTRASANPWARACVACGAVADNLSEASIGWMCRGCAAFNTVPKALRD